jgi:outer membrane protein OmpA-like peptidoglycan-associated protein
LKSLRQFQAAKTELERDVVRFSLNSTELAPGEASKLDDLASRVVLLQQRGSATGQEVTVELRGHTDRSGNEAKNAMLSVHRAQAMAKALVALGVTASMLRTVGMGSTEPVQRTTGAYLPDMNRAVTFRVMNESEAR